jgi:hypothetical protein
MKEAIKKEIKEVYCFVRDFLAILGFLTLCYLIYVSITIN